MERDTKQHNKQSFFYRFIIQLKDILPEKWNFVNNNRWWSTWNFQQLPTSYDNYFITNVIPVNSNDFYLTATSDFDWLFYNGYPELFKTVTGGNYNSVNISIDKTGGLDWYRIQLNNANIISFPHTEEILKEVLLNFMQYLILN